MDVAGAYATLGVDREATWTDVRRAYKSALQRAHPDTGSGDVRRLESLTTAFQQVRAVHRPLPPASRLGAENGYVRTMTAERLLDVYA